MACISVIDNIIEMCENYELAGISKVYLANYKEIASFTSSTSDNLFDAISMKTNPTTVLPYYWYEVAVPNEGGMFDLDVIEGEKRNYVEHTLSVDINSLDRPTMTVVESLLNGGKSVAIVQDETGRWFVLGRTKGLVGKASKFSTGKTAGQSVGGTFTLKARATKLAEYVKLGTTIQVWDGTTPVTVTLQ